MKKILTIASLVATVSVNAQFGYDYLKAADRYYKSGDYASAAAYYEKYFGNTSKRRAYDPYDVARAKKTAAATSSTQARYQLADSYRQLTHYEKAAPVYGQLLTDSTGVTPVAYYHYATVLRALGKYAEAEQSLNRFLDKYTATDEYVNTARRELQNLRFIQEQLAKKDTHQFKIQKIKDGASYAPAFVANNRLLFTATEASKNHLYQAAFTGTELSEVTTAGLPDAPMHEGTPAISADGNTLYFTRWDVKNGKKSAAIYKSNKKGEAWDKPTLLNEMVNASGANAQQPVLTGKYLLYSSDKKGGQGGYDLWIAELDADGQPLSTTNLGATINTPFNEEAPFYHAASKNLVFASNGRVGMGGYDLFYSKGEPGNWAAPVNFGYPVNSVKDDIYFAAHTNAKHLLENVLISSDRTAVCCLELFHVNRSYKQYYSGVVIDCATQQPVPDAVIAVTDANGKKIVDMLTNSQGQYLVETGEPGAFTIVGSKAAYEPGTLITQAGGGSDTITNQSICLSAIPPKKELFTESRLEIRNILFAYDDAAIPVNDFGFLDQVADYLNKHPEARIEIGAHTDGRGSVAYNQKLAARRAQSCYNYLVRAGIDGSRLKAKGYGECCPLEKETTSKGRDIPAAREKNRRIEIKLL